MSLRGFQGPKHCNECSSVRANVYYIITDRNRNGWIDREEKGVRRCQLEITKRGQVESE